MSTDIATQPEGEAGRLPADEAAIQKNVSRRKTIGKIWQWVLFGCTFFGIIVLLILFATIVDEAFGLVAVQSRLSQEEVTGGRELADLSQEELAPIVQDNVSRRIIQRIERNEGAVAELGKEELITIIREEVLQEETVGSWPLYQSLTNRAAIEQEVKENNPRAELQWTSWIDWAFLTTPMSSTPAFAGVRTAILGSLWMIGLTMLFAFPLGVGAAVYLEEYAGDRWYNKIIQTNINNLAGVPSIIYGMLGLAIFVRVLEPITQGRSVLSASLTMSLLILPIIIIASQEAIRAVPNSLRQASYGLGATQWQTIWNHVLPTALPGILTGIILSMSRAIGETAPLIVVGATGFIMQDPSGPLSNFTALPIQIYQWTAQPQDQFRDIAAGGIIVLLVILLTLNSSAIFLRNYLNSRKVS